MACSRPARTRKETDSLLRYEGSQWTGCQLPISWPRSQK